MDKNVFGISHQFMKLTLLKWFGGDWWVDHIDLVWHHLSASLVIIVWKVVGQRRFLNDPGNFTVGTLKPDINFGVIEGTRVAILKPTLWKRPKIDSLQLSLITQIQIRSLIHVYNISLDWSGIPGS